MSEKIRAFYAIDLNDEVRHATQHIIDQLKTNEWNEHVRWTPLENLHLTLRFLGDVSEQVLQELNKALTEKLKACAPFSIMFKEPRLFPHFKKPRVVAVTVAHNEELIQVANIFEECAIAAGLEPENRQFKGHLTLGRCKQTFPRRTKLESLPFSSRLPVNHVTLYQSRLSSEGPTYIELAKLPIGN